MIFLVGEARADVRVVGAEYDVRVTVGDWSRSMRVDTPPTRPKSRENQADAVRSVVGCMAYIEAPQFRLPFRPAEETIGAVTRIKVTM